MKARNIIALSLVPLMMSSCGQKSFEGQITLDEAKTVVNKFSSDVTTLPSYEVRGKAIYCGEEVTIQGADSSGVAKFVNEMDYSQPYYKTLYPKYNLGYYPENPEPGYQDREDAPIHYNGSKSYWTRSPLRIHKNNFYTTYLKEGDTEKSVDPYCAVSLIETNFIILGSVNDGLIYSKNDVKSTVGSNENNGLTITIRDSNARLSIFNFQKYEARLDRTYSNSQAGARINVELVYDNDGWLVSEKVVSCNYVENKIETSTFSFVSYYTWSYGA